jgi:hypothetical protein
MKKVELTKEMAAKIKGQLEEAVAEHCCGEFNGLVSESIYHNGEQCLVIWNESEGLKVELMDTDKDGNEVEFVGEEFENLQSQYDLIVSEVSFDCEVDRREREELIADSYAW